MNRHIISVCVVLFVACGAAFATDRYVVTNNPTPVSPFTNGWGSAATNIQNAINAASVGDTVWVSNGVYNTGKTTVSSIIGPAVYDFRIVLNKAITVRSANNDPANTIIAGGEADVQCVGMYSGSTLIGFTISNGLASIPGQYGAGVRGQYTANVSSMVVSNCIITACSNNSYGGAARDVTLYNCLISNNYAKDGGGGFRQGVAYNSTIIGNYNQGMANGTAYNCLIVNNSGNGGSGARLSTLYNCTIAGNTGATGGGTMLSTQYNCISWSNSTVDNQPTAFHSCGVGYTNGGSVYGNININPQFKDAGASNYRLGRGSPCINTGSNQDWMTTAVDLDGNPRIVPMFGTNVDMGAYEYWVHQGSVVYVR